VARHRIARIAGSCGFYGISRQIEPDNFTGTAKVVPSALAATQAAEPQWVRVARGGWPDDPNRLIPSGFR